jgi:hypothetical protein
MVTQTWQGYLQQLVRYVGHGSHHYCRIQYPEKKREKWVDIDIKLKTKYGAELSKYQRCRRRKSGKASHVFLRWQNQAIVLRGDGDIPDQNDPDIFFDVKKTPLQVCLSEETTLMIRYEHKCQVYIDRNTYRRIRNELEAAILDRRPDIVIRLFNRINGFPSYAGINSQKCELKKWALRECKKHNLKLQTEKLRINTRLKSIKVR